MQTLPRIAKSGVASLSMQIAHVVAAPTPTLRSIAKRSLMSLHARRLITNDSLMQAIRAGDRAVAQLISENVSFTPAPQVKCTRFVTQKSQAKIDSLATHSFKPSEIARIVCDLTQMSSDQYRRIRANSASSNAFNNAMLDFLNHHMRSIANEFAERIGFSPNQVEMTKYEIDPFDTSDLSQGQKGLRGFTIALRSKPLAIEAIQPSSPNYYVHHCLQREIAESMQLIPFCIAEYALEAMNAWISEMYADVYAHTSWHGDTPIYGPGAFNALEEFYGDPMTDESRAQIMKWLLWKRDFDAIGRTSANARKKKVSAVLKQPSHPMFRLSMEVRNVLTHLSKSQLDDDDKKSYSFYDENDSRCIPFTFVMNDDHIIGHIDDSIQSEFENGNMTDRYVWDEKSAPVHRAKVFRRAIEESVALNAIAYSYREHGLIL